MKLRIFVQCEKEVGKCVKKSSRSIHITTICYTKKVYGGGSGGGWGINSYAQFPFVSLYILNERLLCSIYSNGI